MKLLYIIISFILTSCNKTRLLYIDQDKYNDYAIPSNSKLIIPEKFELVAPKTTLPYTSNNKNNTLLPIEKSVIEQTKNFNREEFSHEDFKKRRNKIQRIF